MGKVFSGGRPVSLHKHSVRSIPAARRPKDSGRAKADSFVIGNGCVFREPWSLRSKKERRNSGRAGALRGGVSRTYLAGNRTSCEAGPVSVSRQYTSQREGHVSEADAGLSRRVAMNTLLVAPDMTSGGVACVVRNLSQHLRAKGHELNGFHSGASS